MGVALRAGLGRADRVNGHEWGFAHGFGLTVMKPICSSIRDKHFRNPHNPNPNIMKIHLCCCIGPPCILCHVESVGRRAGRAWNV